MAVRLELLKMGRSRRPWVAASTLALFLALMLFGFYTYAQKETGGQAEFRYTFENASYFNGLTFSLYAFYFGFVLILPIFAATEAGAQIASETHSRTIHLMLARPLSRRRLFLTKSAVSLGYLFLLVGGFLALSLLLGLVAVGWGDLNIYPGVLQMTSQHQSLPQSQALARFLLVWPAATLGLLTTLSLALLLSTWVGNPVNAVGSSVAVYLVLYVVSEIHFFEDLRPLLFTSHLAYWRALFQEHIPWNQVVSEALSLGGFAFLFLGLALWRFRNREEVG
ncbi:MAG TPA: ABC transporter permease subunit [Acidobacteriota bacterium]|nr:ABC transporter permease subunit [Acidobacteriota bacterium]